MHRIVFVKRNNGCSMVPGHIVVGRGDRIRFTATGDITRVQIYFPDTTIFAAGTPNLAEIVPANPARKRVEVDINDAAGDGVYPFAAYCTGAAWGGFASGGSDPEIIIQT